MGLSSNPADILSRLVQVLSALTEPTEIAQEALTLFRRSWRARFLALYQVHSSRQTLHLLAALAGSEEKIAFHPANVLAYGASSPTTRALRERKPFLFTNFSSSELEAEGALKAEGEDERLYSGLCLPLWQGDVCEGCLLALFPPSAALDTPKIQALQGCAQYLALSLSLARLRKTTAEERQRQRAVLDQLPEGILITESSSGLVSYANSIAARVLGVDLDKLLGSTLSVSAHVAPYSAEQDWPSLPWTFAVIRALSGETVHQMEASVTHADGTRASVLCSSAPLRGEYETITGAVLVFQDITAQKQLEAQKQQFFSFASHELRTPLTTVMGYAELLHELTAAPQQEHFDLPTFQRASQQMCVQTEQMMYLIDEMLDLSRLDQGRLELQRAPVDLLALIRRIVENLACTTHIHQFVLNPPVLPGAEHGAHIQVLADNFHLARVLNTLLTNAIKYSPAGGEIEICLLKHVPTAPYVQLSIKDHGLGIAANDLPHLFTRFYRARNLDSAISGLGIGLYLAKNVVELHGGQIWVESAPGQGSTFFLSLPLVPEREADGASNHLTR